MVIWCRVNFVFSCFVSSSFVRTEECADSGSFASLPKKEAPPNFILFSKDEYVCLMMHCVRLLCDVGISCARRLIYPKWADPSSLVVASHYNLHISRNTLIPVCLPFAFAFQLSQRQWAPSSYESRSFSRKAARTKGRLREAEEEARVSGELSSKCVMSDVAFLSMRVKCVGVVYAR